ncbi:monoacylglycerol lipase abhd6-B-like isoform X1 [Apostichopus japonicus]|uniref:monoacylglycerol lipase abhd6-B-like isoform X1 n=2 Tax=Stichopus japonicus TaxID=307972 RepID=UPI003AB30DFF
MSSPFSSVGPQYIKNLLFLIQESRGFCSIHVKMLDYLFCCLELLQVVFRKPANIWRLCIALPVLLLMGLAMPRLIYFLLFQVVFLFVMSYLKPSWIMEFMNWLNLQRNGYSVKYQTVGDFTYCYAERGRPSQNVPSILFLHGLSASKEMWFPMVTAIPRDRHIVLLDMPGHGNSSRRLDYNYSFVNQASRVAQFVITTGLGKKPFHLVGISMGGGVAVAFAATHPRDVTKLSLLCPAGFHTHNGSEYLQDVAKGLIAADPGKLPISASEQHKAFHYIFHVQEGKEIPRLYSWLAFEIMSMKRDIHGKVSSDLEADVNNKVLHRHITKVEAPTQVLWGKYDRLVHPSGAEVVKAALPACQVHMLENCGHTISYDRPFRAMKLILEFLDSL